MTAHKFENPTEQVVYDMITENTGSHMLDSGMIHGYNYNRNSDIHQKPSAWIEDGYVKVNLFHHLSTNLVFNAEVQADFDAYVAEVDTDKKTAWEDLLQGWVELRRHEAGSNGYTYNESNVLSSNFVWHEIELHDGFPMVMIRTHNGCDSRSGFSSPKFFDYRSGYDVYDSDLLRINNAFVYCPSEACEFSADDSYGDNKWRDPHGAVVEVGEDKEGNLICPCCASILKADR